MNFKGEDRERHGTFDIVEQKTGTSLGVHKRMQVRKYYSHFFEMYITKIVYYAITLLQHADEHTSVPGEADWAIKQGEASTTSNHLGRRGSRSR